MRIAILVLVAVGMFGGASAAWARQKADPTPDWRCTVTLHDVVAPGDVPAVITSDGLGPYVDGQGGVTCKVINDPGGTQNRWLFMSITGDQRHPPTRFVQFTGQTNAAGAEYPDFQNHGTFEVLGLGYVVSSVAVMPFRPYLRHPVFMPFKSGYATVAGDSNVAGTVFGGVPTSSVFVQPLGACSWQVTSYLSAPRFANEVPATQTNPRVMRITEGTFKKYEVRGDFPMPFQATVTITSNTSTCP